VLDHARHRAEALRSLSIERAHVVGHSSGASVALQMAVTHPALVRSLVLIEPARPHAPDETTVPAMPRAMNAVPGGRFDDGFDLFLRATCGPGYREAFVRQLGADGLAEAMGSSAYFFAHELPALTEWTFGVREIASVRQPVLLVGGAESVYFTAAYSQRNRALAGELPNADHVCVPGVTHAMPLQDPGCGCTDDRGVRPSLSVHCPANCPTVNDDRFPPRATGHCRPFRIEIGSPRISPHHWDTDRPHSRGRSAAG
jgi:pimeloyl-ACP methyl ester carboxylesterase